MTKSLMRWVKIYQIPLPLVNSFYKMQSLCLSFKGRDRQPDEEDGYNDNSISPVQTPLHNPSFPASSLLQVFFLSYFLSLFNKFFIFF